MAVMHASQQTPRTIPLTYGRRRDMARGLQLATRLQTSLDPVEVLRLFHEALQAELGISQLQCRFEDQLASVELGEPGDHLRIYSISDAGTPLAELAVSRPSAFSAADTQVLEQSIELLTPALRNALLYAQALHQAKHDAITGLPNRQALDECLAREVPLSHRHGHPLSAVMLRLEGLAQIRELYGLRALERAVSSASAALSRHSRQSDLLFQAETDRFVLVMSHTDSAGAAAAAARLDQAMSRLGLCLHGGELPLPLTSAAVSLAPGDTASTLLQRAEQALRPAV